PYFNTPPYIYRSGRLNSRGFDLSDERTLAELEEKLNLYKNNSYTAYPLVPGYLKSDYAINLVYNPSNLNEIVGTVIKAQLNDVEKAINNALDGFKKWSIISPDIRANIIIKMSELIELNSIELIGLLVREAGKTVNNAINEVREAVDFCRYYAEQIKVEFCNNNHTPIGVFACISPWNFPLAIFIGEISSCLAVGNAVIAKPSDQTNLIAFYAVTLFHKAGIPTNVLQLLPGSGSVIGDALTKSNNIKGVIFTGSTDTARLINRNLATKDFNSVLIAETGGQNAMIVDSTALIEQVVQDVIISGFDSAGQRCSALRVLYLQTDVADKIIEAIKGAMDEFKIGNPMDFSTDVGPVIDNKAQQFLVEHIENMRTEGRQIYQSSISSECKQGTFVPPTIIEIENINELKQEFFGPIVHIIRFTNRELDQVMHEINSSGYGLTQGIHSRLEDTIIKVYQGVKAGNIYVNRNMVGAVVGVQPFGGEGLSGTGPKAGGPLYLYRLVNSNIDPQFGTQINPEKLNHINDFLSKLTIVSDSDKEQLINYAKLITSQSLFMKKLELNGPTGENNFMYFDKRGFVGCFANSLVDYARQIICALATNNKVILPYNHITIKLNNIIIDNYISFCDNIDVIDELNAVLVSKDFTNINELKKQLANRNGPLVVTIVEREGEMSGNYPLYLLITEKSISINTTATGGNIELMSVNDNLEEVI
ncbi:MAG: L-glutamate gamma-semialdehyde dehydrogenase, partial [Neisseriaceae bacterium]